MKGGNNYDHPLFEIAEFTKEEIDVCIERYKTCEIDTNWDEWVKAYTALNSKKKMEAAGQLQGAAIINAMLKSKATQTYSAKPLFQIGSYKKR
jgi:bisphosphoglycerate-independent phosphoglycerate mutase (AlkP superfamily)